MSKVLITDLKLEVNRFQEELTNKIVTGIFCECIVAIKRNSKRYAIVVQNKDIIESTSLDITVYRVNQAFDKFLERCRQVNEDYIVDNNSKIIKL